MRRSRPRLSPLPDQAPNANPMPNYDPAFQLQIQGDRASIAPSFATARAHRRETAPSMRCMHSRAAAPPSHMKKHFDPNGIRTRVTAVKGRCPGPLDDRVIKARPISELPLFHARQIAGRIWNSLIHSLSARESAPLRARLRLDGCSELHERFG
jgi:hypothetical protein